MIRFGLAYDQLVPPRTPAVVFAESARHFSLAEKYGFDCIWSGEGHPSRPEHGHVPAPLMMSALVAARTHRIRVGTAVLLLPLYDPLRLAEDVAVLDAYTGGRVILGVGFGHPPLLRRAGLTSARLGARTNAQLTLLRRFWDTPPVTFDSLWFQYRDVRIAPKPAQGPRLPIWVGGASDPAIHRAAMFGDAWIGATQYPFALLKQVASRYRAALREVGKPTEGAVVAANRVTYVAAEGEGARREARGPVRALLGWYRDRGVLRHQDGRVFTAADLRADTLYGELCLVGSPDDIIQQVERAHQQTGLNHIECRVRLPGLRAAQVERTIQLLGQRVLPYFRESRRR
jgi:alkanesulfonate monooxygenase SsuD/methylene tetrahydromethanopterin reductase-like flavin-dependent oxidoreductase (luciferase family)